MNKETINCPVQHPLETVSDIFTQIYPLIAHLQTNVTVIEQTTFPRGTVMPDGRLDLCKQGLGYLGFQPIAEALATNTNIVSLLLGTNGIGNVGAVEVAKLIECNQSLEVIYLGCNHIEKQGIIELSKALINNTYVTGLWLKRNPIGTEGALCLAEMLRYNRKIRTLDLVNTSLGKIGLKAILDVLIQENRTVERLYLGGNQIDEEDAQLLAELLIKNTQLKALLLNVNHLGDLGVLRLAKALQQNQTLVELGLASNGINPTVCKGLIEGIKTHPSLTNLDLGYSPSTKVLGAIGNNLGDLGAEIIAQILPLNSNLLKLNLPNDITEKGKQALIAGLEKNYTLCQLGLHGKQDERIKALLQRNRNSNPAEKNLSNRDVTLIKSVYRTNIMF